MIEKIVIIALIVIAIWATMLYGMIFQFIRYWAIIKEEDEHGPAKYRIPKWMVKPLFDCTTCMTPYYGSAVYWLIWGNSVKEWVFVVIAAMGLVTIFNHIKIR